MRGFIISLYLIFLTGCSATEKGPEKEIWQVTEVSSAGFPVKTGMTMIFSDNSVTFSDKGHTVGYSILKSNDRLVMKTDTSRLLFKIERTSDSTMTLDELYAPVPLTISFINITNYIKHKK